MKAAQLKGYGGQDSLQVTNDAPKPELKPDEVLVEVYAAGLNPFDWKVREGYMKDYFALEFPATLGGDVSGKVAELGQDVTDFTIGQDVMGAAGAVSGKGSYAEYTPVKTAQLVPKPASLDYGQSAAVPLAGVSAYQAVIETMSLKPGQKILIHGGGGGIGYMAIQLANNIGAYVAVTVSAKDVEFVKQAGADEIIDYQSQDFTQLVNDYDAVFDTVGGEVTDKSFQVLKPGGVLVSMAGQPSEELAAKFKVKAIAQSTQVNQERLAALADLVERGSLKIHIDKTFNIDDAAEALEYLKTGHPRGKVVLKVK